MLRNKSSIQEIVFYLHSLPLVSQANAESLLHKLSLNLVKQGKNVSWVTFDSITTKDHIAPKDVRHIGLPKPYRFHSNLSGIFLRSYQLSQLMTYLRPTLLLCWNDAELPSALLATGISRVPLMAVTFEEEKRNNTISQIVRWCFRYTKKLEIAPYRGESFKLMGKDHIDHLVSQISRYIVDKSYEESKLQGKNIFLAAIVHMLGIFVMPFKYRRLKRLKRMDQEAAEALFLARKCRLSARDEILNNEMKEYLALGQYIGDSPDPLFWSDWYLDQYPDVAMTGMNPWTHYYWFGANEGRNPNPLFQSSWYMDKSMISNLENPLLHYIKGPYENSCDPGPLFDTRWCREHYGIGNDPGKTVLEEFYSIGKKAPNKLFRKYPSMLKYIARHYIPCPDMAWKSSDDKKSALLREADAGSKVYSKRFALCTVIVGEYDKPRPVLYRDHNIDYILISDRETRAPKGWDVVIVSDIFMNNPVKHSRYLKMHLYEVIPNADSYEAVGYIDGNIQVAGSLLSLFEEFMTFQEYIGLVPHPYRCCVYHEAITAIQYGKDTADNMFRVIEYLKNNSYPSDNGLFEMNFFIFIPAADVKNFFSEWWSLFCTHGNRDQVLAPYVLWKNNMNYHLLTSPPTSVRELPEFRYNHHDNK